MKKKVTYDDVVRQMFLCRMDCRRLIHSINEFRKKAFACGLSDIDFNGFFLDEALNNAICALGHLHLDEFHFKNGSYADDIEE